VLAQLVFGGVTPLVVSALISATGNRAAPGLYLAAVTALSLCCLAACWRLWGANEAASRFSHAD
jgi:MHS family proline/betaine transporter-like MFS transporter